jgi:predicted transcriptional regulator of viral defense system
MKYIELKENLKNFIPFSMADILKIESDFHPQRLSEWQEKGYITKITKGYYIFSDTIVDDSVLCLLANKIYPPSYVSLEMALSYYGLIPESVFTVTSITTRRTHSLQSSTGQFSYTSIKPNLYFGYRLVTASMQKFKIADPEKALLDYFYNNPSLDNLASFHELRMNKDSFLEQIDQHKLADYQKLFDNKSLDLRITKFLEFIHHA